MTQQDIVFIGSSSTGLAKLSESTHFHVTEVLCLQSRLTETLQNVANERNLRLTPFNWIKDFTQKILTHPTSTIFFIYQLDMLVPGSLTKRNRFFNVHRGNLQTNRGPNPDVWPLLMGHETTALSLHQINHKIDAGKLIQAFEVPITDQDDTVSLKAKMEAGIPVLVEALHFHLTGDLDGEEIQDGKYYPWITENDFTIDPAVDSIETASRKIRSQRTYNGAIVYLNGTKHYVLEMHLDPNIDDRKNSILVMIDGQLVQFVKNPDPVYPPPPIRPPATRI